MARRPVGRRPGARRRAARRHEAHHRKERCRNQNFPESSCLIGLRGHWLIPTGEDHLPEVQAAKAAARPREDRRRAVLNQREK